jgi:WD40 repeat protein
MHRRMIGAAMKDTVMERMQLTRRQILKAGAVGAAGLAIRPMLVLAEDARETESMGPFSNWSTPVNLGPVVNSPANDFHPAISSDGLSLYISSNRPGGYGDNDIWVSQRARKDEAWGAPRNLGANINLDPSSAALTSEFAPDLSPDGHWLFFTRESPPGSNKSDIWGSHRRETHKDFGWEPAFRLAGQIHRPDTDENAPTFFRDEQTGITTIYFNSLLRRDGPGDFDIYASTLGPNEPLKPDSVWGPGVLVPELCSPQRDTRTAIRRDGLEMFITSNRPGGFGKLDLWVSTRATTLDAWSKPVNLGPTVNSTADDGGPALSADGTTLYFYSTRPGGFGGRDLYKTTRTRLEG